MRAIRARIFALFAALVMLLPSAASARTQYYCRMMGRIVASSACDEGAASKAASPAQELQLADCCQRLSSSSQSASLGTLEAVHDVAPATSMAAPQPFVVGVPRDSDGFCAQSTQAPLAIGPPLFIVHCALLS
jgi:hypothetical protein